MTESTEDPGIDVGSKDQEGDPPNKLVTEVRSDDSKSEQDALVKKKKVWPSKYNRGPFICAYCSKQFRGLLDLTRHERTHTNEKPLVCEECGKAFGGDTSLRIHMHVHRNYRPFECKTCGQRFIQKSRLKEHMVVHTDLRPVICKVCGQGLRQKSSLKKHMRMHNDERPYKCDICSRAFRCLADCRKHQRLHADPNSRVNRVPKTPLRKKRRYTHNNRFGRKYLPPKIRSQILEDCWNQTLNAQTSETKDPPLALASGSLISTCQSDAKTNSPVGVETQAQVKVSTPPGHTSIVNGVQTTIVTTNARQNYTTPLASIGNLDNFNGIPAVVPGTNGNSIPFAGPGVSVPLTVPVPVPNPPVLVNANNAVTFKFTPFIFLQTPFGNS